MRTSRTCPDCKEKVVHECGREARQSSTREPRTDLRERLAALEHEQWMLWASTLMVSEPGLSKGRMGRWQDLMLPYSALTEAQKDQDRKWADKVLDAIEAEAAAQQERWQAVRDVLAARLPTSAREGEK